MIVPAAVNVVTLGARDLDKLRDFYRRLGWSLAVDLDDFAAFQPAGAVLALSRSSDWPATAVSRAQRPSGGCGAFRWRSSCRSRRRWTR